MLSRDEQTDLLGLSWHWEGAYTFQVTDGVWSATVADEPATVITADTADELREKIRVDYGKRKSNARGPLLGDRMST